MKQEIKTTNKQTAKKKIFKPVFLFALLPLLSTVLYLLIMGLSTTEDFGFSAIAIVGFLAMTVAWGFVGACFARTRNLLVPSIVIANAIPFLTTAIYSILYIISQINESTAIEDMAVLIGGLGTGLFGILGTLLYAVIPLSLFEVYINVIYGVLVFIVGYAIGASGTGMKKSLFKK